MAGRDAVLLMVALVASFAAVRCGVLALWGFVREGGLRGAARAVRALCQRLADALSRGRVGRMRQQAAQRKYQQQLRAAMPEMLRLLCIALDSGSSLSQALAYAANNCSEPLATELKRAVWDMESGQGFDEAMEKLRTRAGGQEFSYLAVAMEIQHQTGSSLSEVLASVSQSLQNVAELEEGLQTQTAQGRLSAKVVALMPFVLLAVLSVLSPGYLSAFFESAAGLAMLLVALLLELAGVVLVRRALQVDVSAGALGARS